MLLITPACFLQLISLIRLGRNFCDEEIKQSSDFKSFVKDFLKKSIWDTIRIHNALLTRALLDQNSKEKCILEIKGTLM